MIRPNEYIELVKQKHRFIIFFPLNAAVNRKIFQVVGHEDVPDVAKDFPLFRSGTPDRNGKVRNWWLWDGKNEWRVGQITLEQHSLPIREIINDTALIYMIESGWTPESDTKG